MPSEAIETVIDTGKIKLEIEFLKKNLGEIRTTIMDFPVIKTKIEGAAGVKEYSKENIRLAESIKAVDSLVKQRFASEAKLAVLQVQNGKATNDYTRATAANRLELQKQNKELKDQAALNAAGTGSIERARAAVRLLNTERNQLNLYTKEGQEQQQKLNDKINKYNEFIKKSVDALSAQKINVGNYQGSAKIIVDALEKEKKKLEELEKTRIRVQNAGTSFNPQQVAAQRTTVTGFAGATASGAGTAGFSLQVKAADVEINKLNDDIEKSRTIVEGFSRVTANPQFLNVAGKVGDANQELKFFTKSLIDLERNGLGSSQAANELREQLAGLTDEIGDAKAEIKALSSDTRGFDLFADSVTFAADSFQLFAGAAVLAGASEEDAAEATKTLVAVQSVANGVKGIANELTTRGTAANKIFAFSQLQIKTAMDATATSGARLRAIMLTIGFGAVIVGIGLLIANYSKIKDVLSGLTATQKLNNEVTQKATENSAEQISQLTVLINRVKEGGLSFREKTKAVADYNETFGDTLGVVKDYAELEKKLIASGPDYIQYLQLKGNAEAAYQLAIEESKKAILAANNKDNVGILAKVIIRGTTGFGFGNKYEEQVAATSKRISINEVSEAEKRSKDLLAIQQDNINKMNALADKLKLPVAGAKDDKPKKSTTKIKTAKEEVDAEYEIYKINQQRRIDQLNEDVDIEEASFQLRLVKLSDYYNARLSLISANETKELQTNSEKQATDRKGKSAKEQLAIDDEYKKLSLIIQAKYNDERIRLAKEVDDRLVALTAEAGPKAADQAKILGDMQLEIIKKNVAEQEEINKKKFADELAREEALAAKKKELYKELYTEIQSTVFQFLDDNIKREEQDLDEKKRLLDEDTARKIANINQLGLSEVDRVKQTSVIEKQAQFQTEQIEKRKRQLAVERAKFEKAASIASIISGTAQAIVSALKITPGGIALAALIGAIGALQLAKAISTPLPKYFKGTDSAKPGPSIYGELGRELVIPKSGNPYLSPGVPTLTSLIGGERIIPADMTANILNAAGMQRLSGIQINKPVTMDGVNAHLMGKMLGELKDLNRKSKIIIHNTPGIETTAYYLRNIKN